MTGHSCINPSKGIFILNKSQCFISKALGEEFQAGAAEVRLKLAFLQNPLRYEGPLTIALRATDQPRVKDTGVLLTWAHGNLVLLECHLYQHNCLG